MEKEIERKFLVTSNTFKNQSLRKSYIKQGFLNSHEERTVRVRYDEDRGYLTIKGKSNMAGTIRLEWEKEISKIEAQQLMHLCEDGIIEKIRYQIQSGEHTIEVDEFLGLNEGLIIAEIELKNEHELFEKPNWLGREVTGIVKYYNSQLSKNPYQYWSKENLNCD